MNWQNIINNSELIYASTPEDKGFITWSLKKTSCLISFYETYAIEDIDKIICEILDSHGGCIEAVRIATFLGFNVVDDFDVTPKRYADKAEFDIFKAIIKHVFDWGLVTQSDDKIYNLTELGYRALSVGEKYRFFTGEILLFENFGIKPFRSVENQFFPYYSALGLFSTISDIRTISYEKIVLSEVFDIQENDLVKRHSLQSKSDYNIYKSEATNYFHIESCDVDIRIYKQINEYYSIIFYYNQISVEATELLNSPENINLKNIKVEWGLYLKLIKDPNSELDYESIIPFEDLLDLDFLINDTRLVWGDEKLFVFIAENANANQWHSISKQCPIDVIKIHIEKYSQNWDWTSLSFRIDDKFLIDKATMFPWNFEAISAKGEISIDVIKILLLIPELKDQDWAWDTIMPQLEFDFIIFNIETIDFELSELTKTKINEVQPLLIQYPAKRWNWSFISSEYELSYISDNLHILSIYLNLKIIINRAFTSKEYVSIYCNNHYFTNLLTESKESILKDFSPNQANYVWTTQLIDLLDRTKYITWWSGKYTLGFECNPFVEWSYDYFQKYHSKIFTESGYSFVSSNVKNYNIVLDYIDFNWDWDAISSNPNLTRNKEFVLSIADKLNFGILLLNIDSDTLELAFDKTKILSFLEQNPASWLPTTEKVSIDFVRKHIDYNWDWDIITKRFCSTIKIEALGNQKWINKWDWKYLTRNLNLFNVYDNLDRYVAYWDWEYLTENLDREFIIKNLTEYNNYWEWKTLIVKRLDKSDLLFTSYLINVATCISVLETQKIDLWQIVTRKFDYADLEVLISATYKNEIFYWDYSYFYDLPDFNLRSYLHNFSEYVHWKELSGCQKLEETFRYDEKLFSEQVWRKDIFQQLNRYKWDFHLLSKIDTISSDFTILNRYKERWDWDYLSLYSSYFTGLNSDKRKLKSFKQYINFILLSQRENAGLTENIISEYVEKQWDWCALSSNNSIRFSKEFILENKEKQWNWVALSFRNNIKIDNDTFIKLSEKEWDFEAISVRNDISFSENVITQFKDKPLNWLIVSQNKSFVPNATTLSILKGKALDWEAISQNENLSSDSLWDYKENFNWTKITKNKIFEISNSELLSKYQDFIDWKFISHSDKFKLSIKNLKRFKENLHWATINTRKDFSISEEILEPFADVLDWSKISQSMNITITAELIEKYKNKWDWSLLRKNSQVIESLETSLRKYKAEFNCADFIEKFPNEPCIYHFTHLFNAIDIIKSRKILSRNKAEGKFANAAGSLVDRRSTAHNFARFYFRTQTPTQFYNECLGMDSESGYLKEWTFSGVHFSKWKTYYPQARNLGLPKCPMPVFFKFDLNEVVRKMAVKCYYSTGNMQTNWARVEKVCENPNSINTTYLYSDVSDYENYKQYSQQEFLIEEEFDFSLIDSFEIICYDENQANLLKDQLGEDSICEKIKSDTWNIFHGGNRKLRINETDVEVSIFSEYKDSAYLSIQGEGLKNFQILNPDKIQKETSTEIIAYPEIRFTKTEQPIEVHFVDLTIGKRNWLVYKNKIANDYFISNYSNNPSSLIEHICEKNIDLVKLFDSQVRHYTIRKHTEIVCNQFIKYFKNIEISIDYSTFITFLALHDIGKPIAETEGNRNNQHLFTCQIINDNWEKLFDSSKNKSIIMALASSDCIGAYFQKKKQISGVILDLDIMSENSHLDRKALFFLFIIYYQCDVSAYTADAGGYKYLEHLFDYDKNGNKIFDEEEKIIRFSPDYWKMYLNLKTQIWQ